MFGYPSKSNKHHANDKELDFDGIHFRRKPRTNLYVPKTYAYGRYRQTLEHYRHTNTVPSINVRRDWITIAIYIAAVFIVARYTTSLDSKWIAPNDMLPKIQGQIDAANTANDNAAPALELNERPSWI